MIDALHIDTILDTAEAIERIKERVRDEKEREKTEGGKTDKGRRHVTGTGGRVIANRTGRANQR